MQTGRKSRSNSTGGDLALARALTNYRLRSDLTFQQLAARISTWLKNRFGNLTPEKLMEPDAPEGGSLRIAISYPTLIRAEAGAPLHKRTAFLLRQFLEAQEK